MEDENALGLSAENRNFIVGLIFVLLLLFGPIEPYGLAARLAYLVVIPAVAWLLLIQAGERMKIDSLMNDRIKRALLASIAGALVVGAYLVVTAPHHVECSQYVRTADGTDCVGDDVVIKGGDVVGALIALLFAAGAFWAAIADRDGSNS